jgi:tRNA nucleotidyltransferase (CCA-adding enzyme)
MGLLRAHITLWRRRAKIIQMDGCQATVENVRADGRIVKLLNVTPAYAEHPYVFALVRGSDGKEDWRPAFEFYYSREHGCLVARC